jgi:hypothetical protein
VKIFSRFPPIVPTVHVVCIWFAAGFAPNVPQNKADLFNPLVSGESPPMMRSDLQKAIIAPDLFFAIKPHDLVIYGSCRHQSFDSLTFIVNIDDDRRHHGWRQPKESIEYGDVFLTSGPI